MKLAQSSITKSCNTTAVLTHKRSYWINRPFSSSSQPPFESEAKSFLPIPAFVHIEIRPNYHNKNFTPRLALKKRLGTTRKWSNPLY